MNDKIKAIMLKLAMELKKSRWNLSPDSEITFKSEDQISMRKTIAVEGSIGEEEVKNEVDVWLSLTMDSDDQITFYPSYTINGEMFVQGGDIKDINQTMDVDVGFIESNFKDEQKIKTAAGKINRYVVDYVETEFREYLDANASSIGQYKGGGWKADDDAFRDR